MKGSDFKLRGFTFHVIVGVLDFGLRQVLSLEALSFSKFVAFLCRQKDFEAGLIQDIVGEFHADEAKMLPNYGDIYTLFGSALPPDWTAMTIKGSDGEDVKVTASTLCSAGAILPLAKLLVHISSWVKELGKAPATVRAFESLDPKMFHGKFLDLAATRENDPTKLVQTLCNAVAALRVTNHSLATSFVIGCTAKTAVLLSKMVSLVRDDFESLCAKLLESYNAMVGLKEFKEALAKGVIDGKLSASLCSNAGLQCCYHLLTYGMDSFHGTHKLLGSIAAASSHSDFADHEGFVTARKEAHAQMQQFKAYLSDGVEPDGAQTQMTLSTISSAVADVTISQAACRDLKTGETRQGLVMRAHSGIKKRGWKIHPTLSQRVNSVLNGKTGGK